MTNSNEPLLALTFGVATVPLFGAMTVAAGYHYQSTWLTILGLMILVIGSLMTAGPLAAIFEQ